jgi:hypothetical protein
VIPNFLHWLNMPQCAPNYLLSIILQLPLIVMGMNDVTNIKSIRDQVMKS